MYKYGTDFVYTTGQSTLMEVLCQKQKGRTRDQTKSCIGGMKNFTYQPTVSFYDV